VAESQLPAGSIEMLPEMPALIRYNPGNITIPDELKKKILEQMKLVAALKHTLVTEQKTLQMLWKAKHIEKCKKTLVKPRMDSSSSNSATLSERTESTSTTVVSPTLEVTKNENVSKNFKHFWSFYEDLKDDEVEIKEELSCFSIEDLVVEEVTKYRERNN
jgi:hypothetical protein